MSQTNWGLYFEQRSLIKNTLKLLLRGIRQNVSKKSMRLNPKSIGCHYRGKTIQVTPEKIEQFAKALRDDNPKYYGGTQCNSHVAPPMLGIIPTMYSLIRLFSAKEVNVDFSNLMLVGLQSDFFRLVRPGERIYSISTVKDIIDKRGGQLLIIQSDGFTEEGEKLFKDYSTFYIRNRKKFFSGIKDLRQDSYLWTLPESSQICDLEDCLIPRGHIADYSKISGDYNPFHHLGFISRMFGYSTRFLQGTSLAALVSKLLINGPLEGDPQRLKRISLYLWEKVVEGDTLKTQAWNLNKQVYDKKDLWQDPQSRTKPTSFLLAFQVKNQEGSMIIPKGVGMFTGHSPQLNGHKSDQSENET